MIRSLTVILATAMLGGCTLLQGDLSGLPGYIAIGAGVLEAELDADLTSFTLEELGERRSIMQTLNPVLEEASELGAAYLEDIEEEIANRQP